MCATVLKAGRRDVRLSAFDWLYNRIIHLDTECHVIQQESLHEIDDDLREAGVDPECTVKRMLENVQKALPAARR